MLLIYYVYTITYFSLRQKNKNHLTELESVIAKLTQDLAESENERKKLEADRHTYRSKLDSAISVLQSLQDHHSHDHDSPRHQQTSAVADLTQVATNQEVTASCLSSSNVPLPTPDLTLHLDARDGLTTDFWYNGGSLTFPLDVSTPLQLHECKYSIILYGDGSRLSFLSLGGYRESSRRSV